MTKQHELALLQVQPWSPTGDWWHHLCPHLPRSEKIRTSLTLFAARHIGQRELHLPRVCCCFWSFVFSKGLPWTRSSAKHLTREGIYLTASVPGCIFQNRSVSRHLVSVSQVAVVTSLLSPPVHEHVEHAVRIVIISVKWYALLMPHMLNVRAV